jgi:hypothetical protein
MDVKNLTEAPAFMTKDGSEILKRLGCCAPAYEHSDTVIRNFMDTRVFALFFAFCVT